MASRADFVSRLRGRGHYANGVVDLGDAIIALQVVTGLNPGGFNLYADVDDGKVGMGDVIYILEKLGEIR